MDSKKAFIIFFVLASIGLVIIMGYSPLHIKTKSPSISDNASGKRELNESYAYENTSKKPAISLRNVNISFIENILLKKEEIRSVTGDEYEGIYYEVVNNSTLKVSVRTPCADYSINYDIVNDTLISIEKTYPWKKTIKEEPVSEEEKQHFLKIALNDSMVKEFIKGRDFNVSMVKYVMYMACQKARDPDSVHMMFRVDSEIYRVILSPYKDELRVVSVNKIP